MEARASVIRGWGRGDGGATTDDATDGGTLFDGAWGDLVAIVAPWRVRSSG